MDDRSTDREIELIDEIGQLRQEFQEYADRTAQYQANRRVENIQVLIALSVVGGAISISSSNLSQHSLWQNLAQSPFWRIVLLVFIGSNGLFLLLKLLTIPLMPLPETSLISYIHEELEPFLYFFAVLGLVFTPLVWVVAKLGFKDLSPSLQSWLGVSSLILPGFLALGHSQVQHLRTGLQQYQQFIINTNEILVNMADSGRITQEMAYELRKALLYSITPKPAIVILANNLIEIFDALFDLSDETVKAVSDLLKETARVYSQILFLGNPGMFASLGVNMVDLLFDEDRRKRGDKEREKEVEEKIIKIRLEGKQGTLDEEELLELYEYLRTSRTEDQTGEESESGSHNPEEGER